MSCSEAPSQKRRRILCVDDDSQVRAILSAMFTRAGYEYECAADGEAALELFAGGGRSFKLVITDHQMANLNGLAFVARLRELGFSGGIIVHSSPLHAGTRAAYHSLHVDAIVEKPASTTSFLKTIATLIGDPPAEGIP